MLLIDRYLKSISNSLPSVNKRWMWFMSSETLVWTNYYCRGGQHCSALQSEALDLHPCWAATFAWEQHCWNRVRCVWLCQRSPADHWSRPSQFWSCSRSSLTFFNHFEESQAGKTWYHVEDSGKEGVIRTRQKMAASTQQYLPNAGESGMVLATFGREFCFEQLASRCFRLGALEDILEDH